jgi:hypothetical protein
MTDTKTLQMKPRWKQVRHFFSLWHKNYIMLWRSGEPMFPAAGWAWRLTWLTIRTK